MDKVLYVVLRFQNLYIVNQQQKIFVPEILIQKNISSIISAQKSNPLHVAENNILNLRNKNRLSDTIICGNESLVITHGKLRW